MNARAQMAEFIVANLTDAERSTLTRLACARFFDAQVFAAIAGDTDDAAEARTGLAFEQVIGLPLVNRYRADAAAYELMAEVRESLLERIEDRVWRAVSEQLYQLYREQDAIEALYHLFVADSAAAARLLRELFEAAEQSFDLARCHLILQVAMERRSFASPRTRRLMRELMRRMDTARLWAEERYSTVFYVERAEVEEALRDLLAIHTDTWILHVHAPGGRGKTMFIDATISRLCAPDIPCAKIDFDYVIHTVAVSREPWRLIIRMAEQLAVQMEDRALADLVDEYRDLVVDDFSLSVLPRGRARVRGPARERDSLTSEITRRFASIVTDRMGNDPVLLVFDTLENAMHAPGSDIERIAETLARVRELVTGLRVILAGRFNLATRVTSLTRTLANEARVVEIPPFSRAEAESYLRRQRGLAQDDLVAAIAEKAGGNPLKLALLADEVDLDPELRAEVVLAFPQADLFYLVDRVIDRIENRRVRWLVRWGVLPPRLSRGFFEGVLWPLLSEQLAGRTVLDQPDNDPALLRDRQAFAVSGGPAAGDQAGEEADPASLWHHLEQYVAASSWVSRAGNGGDAVVFHPDVREPMRGILRDHQQLIWTSIHERAIAWWQERAQIAQLHRDELVSCVRAAMFHALQLRGAHERAWAVWRAICREHVGDHELLAEVAREVLDAADEHPSVGRSPVAPGLRVAAHLALATAAVTVDVHQSVRQLALAEEAAEEVTADAGQDPHRLEHVGPLALVRGLVAAAQGQTEAAERQLSAALTAAEGDTALLVAVGDRLLAHRALAALRADAQPQVSLEHRRQAWLLAREAVPAQVQRARAEYWRDAMQAERYEHLTPGDDRERLQYLLAVGRVDAAAEILHELPMDERDAAMHGWVHLELGEALEARAALGTASTDLLDGDVSPDAHSVWALTRAQLCDLEQALLYGDVMARRVGNGRPVWQLTIALARACIEHGACRTADRLLTELAEPSPSWDLWVARDLVRIQAVYRDKRVDEARGLWRRLDRDKLAAPDAPPLAPSVRVFAAALDIALGGDADAGIIGVCDLLDDVRPVSRRLRLLDPFRAVDVPLLSAPVAARLYQLVSPALDERGLGAMQRVRFATLLRLCAQSDRAETELCALLTSAEAPVARMAWRELDRLGRCPEGARPVALERYGGEKVFVGVVSLERAERLQRYGHDSSVVAGLLDICDNNLPGSAVAPWRERARRLRIHQYQLQAVEHQTHLYDETWDISQPPSAGATELIGRPTESESAASSVVDAPSRSTQKALSFSVPARLPAAGASAASTPPGRARPRRVLEFDRVTGPLGADALKRQKLRRADNLVRGSGSGVHEDGDSDAAALEDAASSVDEPWLVARGLVESAADSDDVHNVAAEPAAPPPSPPPPPSPSHGPEPEAVDARPSVAPAAPTPAASASVPVARRHQPPLPSVRQLVVEWRGAAAWHVQTADRRQLVYPLQGPLSALQWHPERGTVPEEAARILPAHWREMAHTLGDALADWACLDRLDDDEGVSIEVVCRRDGWIPWELACWRGQPIGSRMVLTRAAAGGQEQAERNGAVRRVPAQLVLVEQDGDALGGVGAASWYAGFSRAGLRARVIGPEQAAYSLSRHIAGPTVVHLAGAFQTHRERVYLHMPIGERGQSVAAHPGQLARALAGAANFLVILSARRPSSPAEQARQLILRNTFAAQLVAGHPGGAVLGIGLSDADSAGIALRTVVNQLAQGSSVGDLAHALHQWSDASHWHGAGGAGSVAPEDLQSLAQQAVYAGLQGKRARLLRGMEREVVRELPLVSSDPAAQMTSDLTNLGRLASDGITSGLSLWIENAVSLVPTAGAEQEGETADETRSALVALRATLQEVLVQRSQKMDAGAGAADDVDHVGTAEETALARSGLTSVRAFEQVLPFAGCALFTEHPELVLAIERVRRDDRT